MGTYVSIFMLKFPSRRYLPVLANSFCRHPAGKCASAEIDSVAHDGGNIGIVIDNNRKWVSGAVAGSELSDNDSGGGRSDGYEGQGYEEDGEAESGRDKHRKSVLCSDAVCGIQI